MGDDERLRELEESVRQLRERDEERESQLNEERTARERAEDALLTERATRVVSEFIDDNQEGDNPLPELPDRAWTRVRESALSGKLPLDEDGKLVPERLEERIRKAAKDEAEYLGVKPDEGGAGRVRGMGRVQESNNDDDDEGDGELSEADAKKLEESMQRLGSSEAAAKTAVRGR